MGPSGVSRNQSSPDFLTPVMKVSHRGRLAGSEAKAYTRAGGHPMETVTVRDFIILPPLQGRRTPPFAGNRSWSADTVQSRCRIARHASTAASAAAIVVMHVTPLATAEPR